MQQIYKNINLFVKVQVFLYSQALSRSLSCFKVHNKRSFPTLTVSVSGLNFFNRLTIKDMIVYVLQHSKLKTIKVLKIELKNIKGAQILHKSIIILHNLWCYI